jgi:hypothetical protein
MWTPNAIAGTAVNNTAAVAIPSASFFIVYSSSSSRGSGAETRKWERMFRAMRALRREFHH